MTQNEALLQLAREHGGLLKPAVVVEAARDVNSPLHSAFDWDDSVAAQKWRLQQARELIMNIKVTIPEGAGEVIKIRAMVALSRDVPNGGGYRIVSDVVSDVELYRCMCMDAANELRCFRQKYSRIKELRSVFAAGDEFLESLNA